VNHSFPSPAGFEFHEAPTQPGISHTTKKARVEPPLVLVVEDDDDTRFIYTQSLEHMGYRSVGARSGELGYEAALQLKPSAIVMDVAMPGIGGIEATRRLKADPRTRSMLVIVVTAYGAAMFDAARQAGCDAYFCKPFNAFALDSVLRQLRAPRLQSRRLRGAYVKRCGCGRHYTHDAWLALPLCGRMHVPGTDRTIELRNCSCGSSLGVPLDDD
jgi:CheY-like chemotaxis protein